MQSKPKFGHPAARTECHRHRLAESEVAAVDVCQCGTMQLHLGALTVRLTPDALGELLGTLGEAVAAHAALRVRARGRVAQVPYGRGERGKA